MLTRPKRQTVETVGAGVGIAGLVGLLTLIGAKLGGGHLGGGGHGHGKGLACDEVPADVIHKPGTPYGGGKPCDFNNPSLGQALDLLPNCTTPLSVWSPGYGIVDHDEPSYGYGAPDGAT